MPGRLLVRPRRGARLGVWLSLWSWGEASFFGGYKGFSSIDPLHGWQGTHNLRTLVTLRGLLAVQLLQLLGGQARQVLNAQLQHVHQRNGVASYYGFLVVARYLKQGLQAVHQVPQRLGLGGGRSRLSSRSWPIAAPMASMRSG